MSEKKPGFFSRLAQGLKRSSTQLGDSVTAIFTKRKLDAAALEELEDALIAADLGAPAAARVTERLARDRFDREVRERASAADRIEDAIGANMPARPRKRGRS